jgi:hypothetical protein
MSPRPTSTAAVATAVAALMLFTAGCSGSPDTVEKASSPTSSAGSPSSDPAAAPKDKVDSGAAAAGIDPMNLPKPVGSFTAPLPYDKDRKTTGRFDIYSLKRQGKLAILTMSVTPTFSTVESASLFSLMGNHGLRPTLVDPVNLREYAVLRGGSGPLVTNNVSARSYSGEPIFFWAAFAAPPANVAKINLNLYDTLPPVMDVPVQ